MEAIRVSPLELPSQCHLHRVFFPDPCLVGTTIVNKLVPKQRDEFSTNARSLQLQSDRPSEAAVASAEPGSQGFSDAFQGIAG